MVIAVAACLAVPILGSAGDTSDQIADAVSAAWPGMAENVSVVDWEGNEWIEEGGHLMILAPAELLEAYPTDPNNGGPYVMWKGTPYAHLMVPIGSRD